MLELFRTPYLAHRGYIDIDPEEVSAYPDARLVDVREPSELVGPLGYIHGVDNIPIGTFSSETLREWAFDDEIIVICRSGGRSARVAADLASAGFRRVKNLRGGMLAWNAAGLPNALETR